MSLVASVAVRHECARETLSQDIARNLTAAFFETIPDGQPEHRVSSFRRLWNRLRGDDSPIGLVQRGLLWRSQIRVRRLAFALQNEFRCLSQFVGETLALVVGQFQLPDGSQ